MQPATWRRQGQQVDQKRQNMSEYLEWYLTPESEREPKTKTAIAEQIGVTTRTLTNYERDRWFQVEAQKRRKDVFRATRLEDIIDSMYEIATAKWTDKGAPSGASVTAGKFLMGWVDKAVEDQDIDAETMTDEELRSLAERLQKLVEEFHSG